MNDCAMCNFIYEYASLKYRENCFRYPYPFPVPVWKQFLDIHIRLQSANQLVPAAGYPTGKPDGDHLCWTWWTTACWSIWSLSLVYLSQFQMALWGCIYDDVG